MPEPKSTRLGFVAGTIPEDKLNSFERLLFRATRGNMYLKSASVGAVVDPTTTEKVEKSVFVVFFAGERARSKILKVWIMPQGKVGRKFLQVIIADSFHVELPEIVLARVVHQILQSSGAECEVECADL